MIDGYQVCAGLECAFNLDRVQGRYNGWENMASAEQLLTHGHEVRASMIAIPN